MWYNMAQEGHTTGINAVSWGPALHPISFRNVNYFINKSYTLLNSFIYNILTNLS